MSSGTARIRLLGEPRAKARQSKKSICLTPASFARCTYDLAKSRLPSTQQGKLFYTASRQMKTCFSSGTSDGNSSFAYLSARLERRNWLYSELDSRKGIPSSMHLKMQMTAGRKTG